MLVTPGFEGLLKYEVPICVVGNHDILVTRLCFDREAACIICVEFADGLDPDVDVVGRGLQVRGWGLRGSGVLGFGRLDVLALLCEMTHDGFIRVGAVPGCIGEGKPFK